jgi:hypothetical protein
MSHEHRGLLDEVRVELDLTEPCGGGMQGGVGEIELRDPMMVCSSRLMISAAIAR